MEMKSTDVVGTKYVAEEQVWAFGYLGSLQSGNVAHSDFGVDAAQKQMEVTDDLVQEEGEGVEAIDSQKGLQKGQQMWCVVEP